MLPVSVGRVVELFVPRGRQVQRGMKETLRRIKLAAEEPQVTNPRYSLGRRRRRNLDQRHVDHVLSCDAVVLETGTPVSGCSHRENSNADGFSKNLIRARCEGAGSGPRCCLRWASSPAT